DPTNTVVVSMKMLTGDRKDDSTCETYARKVLTWAACSAAGTPGFSTPSSTRDSIWSGRPNGLGTRVDLLLQRHGTSMRRRSGVSKSGVPRWPHPTAPHAQGHAQPPVKRHR